MSVPRLSVVLLNVTILAAGLGPAALPLAAQTLATPPSSPAPQAAPAPPAPAAPARSRDENLPPSEAQAKAGLEKSPRHGEYVDVKMPSGGAPIRTWIVREDLRNPCLRRRRPRLPAGPGRPRGRQPQGDAERLAAHGGLSARAFEIAGLAWKPP
jgi:hypothetical protein